MSVWNAVLLGLVEGLTEWLPISSTGHLTVTQGLLGINGDAAVTYAIVIQAGAIMAVVSLYRTRFAGMVAGLRGRDPQGRRTLLALIFATAPAAVVGLALDDAITTWLFGPWPVVVAWFAGGCMILALVHCRRGLRPTDGAPLVELSPLGALVIGCAQVLALWPGVSRSLVTILAAVVLGLSMPAAVEFSFLLGFVTLGGATLYAAASSGVGIVDAFGVAAPLCGLVVAFVASVLAMRWMVSYVTRRGLRVFGWYRIAVAVLTACLLVTGLA